MQWSQSILRFQRNNQSMYLFLLDLMFIFFQKKEQDKASLFWSSMMADHHYHRDYCYQDELFQHVLTKIQADDDNPDVMVLCRNEEIVQTRKSLLSLYSPVFRSMMGSIPGGTGVPWRWS